MCHMELISMRESVLMQWQGLHGQGEGQKLLGLERWKVEREEPNTGVTRSVTRPHVLASTSTI